MGEGVLAYDSLVALHLDARDVGHQPAGRVELLGDDPAPQAEVVAARPHGHHDFLQGAIAGPLADAVDGTLDLPGALVQGREAVGHGQAQVVVTVYADDHLVDAADGILQVADGGGVLLRHGVANRVRDVDRGRSRLDGSLHDFRQEVELRSGRVFGREFNVFAVFLRPVDALDGPAQDFLLGHLQLEFAVNRARGQEDVDARPGGAVQGFPGAVDVVPIAPSQPADHRPFNLPGDRLHGLEVPGRCDGETRLDDINAEFTEGTSHLELLGEVHARSRRLLAVAQRGVEDDQAVVGHVTALPRQTQKALELGVPGP